RQRPLWPVPKPMGPEPSARRVERWLRGRSRRRALRRRAGNRHWWLGAHPRLLEWCQRTQAIKRRVSTRGVFPTTWSFDTVGPIARKVIDLAAILQVLAG